VVLWAIIWAPSWVFILLLDLVILGAGWELLRMARISGVPCSLSLGTLALATFLGAEAFAGIPGMAASVLAWALLLSASQIFRKGAPKGSLGSTAIPVFIMIYLGGAGLSLGWLRLLSPEAGEGIRVLLLFLLTIWVGDSGAYYIGKNFGKRKMAPILSPKKTWEGLAGGVGASFVGAAVFHLLFPLSFGWFHVMAIAGILAFTAPLGDLVESVFKRDTGVKDSSNLIPGHGGLLDRTDSLFFSAPFVLLYLWMNGLYSLPA